LTLKVYTTGGTLQADDIAFPDMARGFYRLSIDQYPAFSAGLGRLVAGFEKPYCPEPFINPGFGLFSLFHPAFLYIAA
jgi:hypothetical protein